MKKAFTWAGISIVALAAVAHAGAPIKLNDRQMEAVTAGSAQAIAAFHSSAAGQYAAIQTSVANVAAEFPYGSLAQSRTALSGTAAGKAALATDIFSQSSADSHGPPQLATASTTGSANGDKVAVDSVGVTTAISASGRSGRSSIGIAESLARVTAFSASGRPH